MAALAADLEAVRVAVQEAVKTRGKKWKDTTWSFLSEVISFLLSEAATRTTPWRPLILYGVTNEKELQGVGQGEYAEFKRQLAEEGVPKAICDLLFAKNVAVAIGAAPSFGEFARLKRERDAATARAETAEDIADLAPQSLQVAPQPTSVRPA
jgi:hypothetical protein